MVLSVGSSVIMSKRKSTAGTPSLWQYSLFLQNGLHSSYNVCIEVVLLVRRLSNKIS